MALPENPKKINKPNYTRLPTDRYVQLMTDCKDTVIEFGADSLKIVKYFETVFMVLFASLLEAFKKASKSSFTELIAVADKKRDEAYYALCDLVKAMLRHRNEEVRNAAKRIQDFIKEYGNIARKSLDGQTAATTDLISELKGRFEDDVKLIKAEDWVEELEVTNKNFDDLMKQRNKESRNKTDLTIGAVRKELDEAFRTLCSMVEVLAITEGGDVYPKFIKALNVVFARYGVNSTPKPATPAVPEETPAEPEEKPTDTEEKPTEPVEPEKYPDAKEWTKDYNPNDWKNGDIAFVYIDGVKHYYELIDQRSIDVPPYHEEYAGTWKILE